MATAVLSSPAFTLGEVGPALFGRFDTARMHTALATCRNAWPSFRGGAYSRAGTAFVGFSKQTGRSVPPRLIPFQFSINQGLALEFGNYYMRVVKDGAFVTESPFEITGASKTDPCVLTYATLSTGMNVAANIGAVTASYVRGDTVTLAGGSFITPAVVLIENTTLSGLAINAAGSGYAVNDIVTLSGGTNTQPPVITVTAVDGSGGITTFAISNGGVFTTNGSGNFTQASTSGAGTGATSKTGIFAPGKLSFQNVGSYTSVPSNPANQGSTTGSGTGATFTVQWATPDALSNGDWVFVEDVGGMTQLNNQSFIIGNLTPTTMELFDIYNNPIDATAFGTYTSGGTASRIYTLPTTYAEEDLEFLKFTQSADVMSLCCVNQDTLTEYPAQDLTRAADDDWSFTLFDASPTCSPPTNTAGSASSSGSADYVYGITSVNPDDGTESVVSTLVAINSAVNIAATAGTNTITWTPVAGINVYNIYRASIGIGVAPPAGSLLGFVGTAYGGSFIDSNITPDFAQVPPTHQNPFAKGQITGARVTAGGSGASFTVTINSVTGSGAVLVPIVVSSVLVGFYVQAPGQNYLPTDTLTINNGATATLIVSAQSGTYPAVPGYFQQRRVYGYTLNNPDTYFMSQPGSFTNFNFRVPTIDTDAITGSPWATQVNGIQFMLQTSGGLLVFTGLAVWLLVGAGSFATNVQPISPASQDANPQPEVGCSPTVPPIKINYDVLYVSSLGTVVYDLPYQLYTLSEPLDLTVNSPQLFSGYTIKESAWCEHPYKIIWYVRDDGIMLSLTYFKPEKVDGWGRHDTDGSFETVCAVIEPPIDALYLGTQRMFGANQAYVIERMNNRIWSQAENVWAVDCGFSLAQPTPAAKLTASSAVGLGSLTGVTDLVGGQNYSAGTQFSVVDDDGEGPGSGAVVVPTIVGGVVTNLVFSPAGSGYVNPKIVALDPAGSQGGSDFSATVVLNNSMTFSADAAVFAAGDVGKIIRMGGGIAEVTAFVSSQQVTANMLAPIVRVAVNASGDASPLPAPDGSWSMTAAVSSVYLPQLAGATVTGLADGNVISPRVVPSNGVVNLDDPASAVIIGMGFQAQIQSVYIDTGEPTVQGQRKKIAALTARMQASRGVTAGTNQIDGSTLSPPQIAPQWDPLNDVEDKAKRPYNGLCEPLYTGDSRLPLQGGFATPGQIAMQQNNPLPMEVLAFIPEILGGDKPEQAVSPKQEKQARRQAA